VKIGALTVVYQDLALELALDRLAELGLQAVELGTGNYPGSAHCDPDALLAEPRLVDQLRRAVETRGLTISALSCHGNPLHPDPDVASAAHAVWCKTAQLANCWKWGSSTRSPGVRAINPGPARPIGSRAHGRRNTATSCAGSGRTVQSPTGAISAKWLAAME